MTVPRDGTFVNDYWLSDRSRLGALDLLRLGGTFAVVALHAAIAYTRHPLPGLAWPVHQSGQTVFVDTIFWAIQGMIMPLFFVLSGMFASTTLVRKDVREFMRHRMRRLGGPLLFGTFAVLPLSLYVWVLGWVVSDRYPAHKLLSLKFSAADDEAFWGFGHLWYLVYLLIYCGVWAWVYHYGHDRGRFDLGRVLRRYRGALGFVCIALVGGICLAWTPRIVLGFRHGFFPYATNLAYYACWFLLGASLTTGDLERHRLVKNWKWTMLVACGLLPAFAYFADRQIAADEQLVIPRLIACLLIPMYAYFSFFAWTGLCLHCHERVSPTVARLSETSFWVYLAHHPIVGLFQVALYAATFTVELKFALTLVGALFVAVGSYYVLALKTPIIRVFQGVPRKSDHVEPVILPLPDQTSDQTRRAA